MKHKGSEQEEGKRDPDGAPCDKKRFKRTLASTSTENTNQDEERHEGSNNSLLQLAQPQIPTVSRQVVWSGTDTSLLTMLHMLEERRESAILTHQATDQLDNSIAQILSYLDKLNC